jgi:hypothetical protein
MWNRGSSVTAPDMMDSLEGNTPDAFVAEGLVDVPFLL